MFSFPRLFRILIPLAVATGGLITVWQFRPRVPPVQAITSNHPIISEVAWAGTAAGSADEWIELYHGGNQPIPLAGWTLSAADGSPSIALTGTLPAGGFYLLERTDDSTVSDIPADLIYAGALSNSGEQLTLRNPDGLVVDTANGGGGAWPAGTADPPRSMERVAPTAADAGGWTTHAGPWRNGQDAAGAPIDGTPRQPNAAWESTPGDGVDLRVTLSGPAVSAAGQPLTYAVSIANAGSVTATDVRLTDTLPVSITYVSDTAPFAGETEAGRRIWHVDMLAPGAAVPFSMTLAPAPQLTGIVVNQIAIGASEPEQAPVDNQADATTRLGNPIWISALLFDGYENGDLDEAVALHNLGSTDVDLGGWTMSNGSTAVELPPLVIAPDATVWLARDGAAFARQFGFPPAAVPSHWPGLANGGGFAELRAADGVAVDAVAYGAPSTWPSGWTGPAVQPYVPSTTFGREGQILYRIPVEDNMRPAQDSNSAADWAQQLEDPWRGRKVRYPGWDLAIFGAPAVYANQSATVQVAVAPDNAFSAVKAAIDSAQHSIRIETLHITNYAVMEALVAAAERGVTVTILMEGEATSADARHQRNYLCQMLDAAPGPSQCWFMHTAAEADIYDRYRNVHAKFMLVDWELYNPDPALSGAIALIMSENLTGSSLPFDDKSDGTWGRRGVVLQTDAPPVAARLMSIFSVDLDPANHVDIAPWSPSDPEFGAPPADFVPNTASGGITYTVRYTTPATFTGAFDFEIVQAPENNMRPDSGLFGLVAQATAGDTVLVQQLDERIDWGPAENSVASPRLTAYIDAARRGATVRLMLDGYHAAEFWSDPNDPTTNTAVCRYVNDVSRAEALDLHCALANPAGLGIHNKMVLVSVGGAGFVHVGSLNGTEASHKLNREVALQIRSTELFAFLAELFWRDWPQRVYIPLVAQQYIGRANTVLISEVYFDGTGGSGGVEEDEFVELYNPTPRPIDISGYSLSDATSPEAYADLRRFPPGSALGPGETIVVALRGTAFWEQFGVWPTYEIVASHPEVPDLIDDPGWGAVGLFIQWGNRGDAVIVRDDANRVITALAYWNPADPPSAGMMEQLNTFVLEEGRTLCEIGAEFSALYREPPWREHKDCAQLIRMSLNPTPFEIP